MTVQSPLPAEAVLRVQDVSKSYGAHQALCGVNFSIRAGETAALLGENGAGKSTLARILTGAQRADGGHIAVDGRPVTLTSPRKALEEGIAFIPQELLYVPRLTVAENICLGRWPTRNSWTSANAMRRQAANDCTQVGLELDLWAEMASLSIAQQQMVEIVKAFARRARAVVLDEQTAALSADDSDLLLRQMARLAKTGAAILYISHRIDEVFRACDTVHVIRNGVVVHSAPVTQTTPREVIVAMLGRMSEDVDDVARSSKAPGPVALRVRRMSKASTPPLHDIAFDVRRGEIVGVYGVRGSGAESVAEILGGLHKNAVLNATVSGTQTTRIPTPRSAKRLKIAHVPAERKSQGLVLSMAVRSTMTLLVLGQLSRMLFIQNRRERVLSRQLADDVLLRARTLSQPVGDLSGGNQQKALLASRLATKLEILVLHEPTRGVDVGARLEVHRLIRAQADKGTAVLLVSSDIEEIAILSDRVLVVAEGAIAAEFATPSLAVQHQILEAAGGFV